jgi:hypothetical protein
MKKLVLLPLFFFAALAVSKGQPPVTSVIQSTNGPVLTFDELEFDFGTITQGDTATHVFKFKNTGNEPLIISEAHGSCGCTQPIFPKEPIKPNGTGVMKVSFNSAGKLGVQDKMVTVTYGDGLQAFVHMKGTVQAPNVKPAPTTPATNGNVPTDKTQGTSPAPTSTTAPAGGKTQPANKPKK